jgi:hypothetical protein
MHEHNLKRLLDAGLCITINSDDPAYFGGYLNENYFAIPGSLDLSQTDIIQLAQNGIGAAFISPERKAALTAELAAVIDATGRWLVNHIQSSVIGLKCHQGTSVKPRHHVMFGLGSLSPVIHLFSRRRSSVFCLLSSILQIRCKINILIYRQNLNKIQRNPHAHHLSHLPVPRRLQSHQRIFDRQPPTGQP